MAAPLHELAPSTIIEALFATISYRLEPQGRGSRFPIVMQRLYAGGLKPAELLAAAAELDLITSELRTLPKDRAISSLETLAPFRRHGLFVNDRAASLAELFVASDGTPLLAALRQAVERNRLNDSPVKFNSPEVQRQRAALIFPALCIAAWLIYLYVPNRQAAILAWISIASIGVAWLWRRRSKRVAIVSRDIEMGVEISAKDAVEGATLTVTPRTNAKPVMVKIPPGRATEGMRLRLQGEASPGDLYLIIHIRP